MILISTSVIDFRPTYALPDQERPGGIQVILDANTSVLFNRKQLLQPFQVAQSERRIAGWEWYRFLPA